MSWEGLLVLTALAVGSLPAVALAAVAPRPEDAHALVHAGVGLAQVHRASRFCNRHKHRAGSGTPAFLLAKTHIHQECCKNCHQGPMGLEEHINMAEGASHNSLLSL